MSVQAMTWAYRQTGLKSGAKFLLVTLANYADGNGECFPSVQRLSFDTGMSSRNVIRGIQELANRGYLESITRPGDGSGRKSNVYRLIWGAKPIIKDVSDEGQSDKSSPPQSAKLSPMQSDKSSLSPKCQIVTLPGGQSDKFAGQSDKSARQSANLSPYPSEEPSEEPSDIFSSGKKIRAPSEKKTIEPKDLELAEWMWSYVDGLAPGQKAPNLEKWAETIRLMRERDKRRPEDIRAVFQWAHNDNFWRTNIRSPEKLRKQFDQLNAKRLDHEKHGGPGPAGGTPTAGQKHHAIYAKVAKEAQETSR